MKNTLDIDYNAQRQEEIWRWVHWLVRENAKERAADYVLLKRFLGMSHEMIQIEKKATDDFILRAICNEIGVMLYITRTIPGNKMAEFPNAALESFELYAQSAQVMEKHKPYPAKMADGIFTIVSEALVKGGKPMSHGREMLEGMEAVAVMVLAELERCTWN